MVLRASIDGLYPRNSAPPQLDEGERDDLPESLRDPQETLRSGRGILNSIEKQFTESMESGISDKSVSDVLREAREEAANLQSNETLTDVAASRVEEDVKRFKSAAQPSEECDQISCDWWPDKIRTNFERCRVCGKNYAKIGANDDKD